MLNMRNRVLLYVVHFVICFFVHENGNVDIIAEYRFHPYQNGSVLQFVRDLLLIHLSSTECTTFPSSAFSL